MGTLPCPLCCDNKFSSRLSLKHHLLEIESKIQCPDCYERFCSILELANHLGGQCWKPTEVIEIKNEVLDTKEFLEGYYKSEDDQIAGNIADDSNSPLQEVESVISGLTEESTSQMAIDPLDNMAVMTKSEVDSDSEDSLSFKAEMDVENVEEFKIDEPSSHQHRPIILKMDKRRIEKKPYDGKTLETGVRKVLQEDWSVYKTSKFYGIPWTTLKENVLKASKHFNINTNELNKFELGKVGRPFALSSGIEQQLATYIIKMQECGFGLTVLHIRKLAYKLAEKAGVAGRFNPERKTAGKKWYLGFKERYNLTLRKPENLSRYQASCANQTLIQGFYDCLEKVLDEHNLRESPNQIWNCDETGMMFVTAGSKIVTSLGKKYIYRRVYAEKGTTTTVLGSANAAGKSGPFLIIFKGIQNIPALKSGANCDATVAVTPKGWISSELFVKWMQEFIKSLPPERPVILLMDSHASHLSPEAIQLAEDNSIILITFPSHTTHQLQPLDLCVYKSLKAAWSSELDTETRRNPGKTPSRYDFHRLFNPCYEKSFCPKIIKSGFNKAGIVPFDRNAVSPEALVPSSVSENPEEGNRPNEIQTNDEILPIPVCDQTPIRNTRRKSQSARVDTISPTVSADPQPGPSSARLNQGPRARNVMETPNGTENSVCPVCSLDYQHDLRNSTGAQWIQCCFCLKWYHNKCEGLGDNFDEDVYMCSSCED